jgi:hypothetical protein
MFRLAPSQTIERLLHSLCCIYGFDGSDSADHTASRKFLEGATSIRLVTVSRLLYSDSIRQTFSIVQP